jgi:tryptophanyl-tRNA synthetase
LHIGNYIGAIKQWVAHQHHYDSIFCIVDLHALTIPESARPSELRSKSREVAALYVACGIDPDVASIFVQSHVKEHAELAWVLNCVTPIGWLERMTQYKSKSESLESISTALLDYPVLQAADILLYRTELVPVGEDQRQHIELTRDIAQRFNRLFGELFVVPEALIPKTGARIMGLDAPDTKMSKSLGEQRTGHSVGLLDDPTAIRKAIMAAVTDSGKETRYEHASPGVVNLLTLYQAVTGKGRQEIEQELEGKGYGHLKRQTADAVIAAVEPVQRRYRELASDATYVDELLARGAERVRPLANQTVERVKELTGLG